MMEAEPPEDVALQALLVGKTSRDAGRACFPIAVASYGLLLWNLLYASMVPLMPAYAEELGLTSTEQATVLASLQVGWLVGLPALLLFRAGKPLLYVGGMLHVLAPCVLLLFRPSFGLFVLVRGLEGVGSCFVTVLLDAMLMRQLPQSMRGRGIAARTAIGTLGLLSGPLVGGWIMPRYGMTGVFVMLVVAGAFGLALYTMIPSEWIADSQSPAHLNIGAKGFGMFLPVITGEWFKAGVLFSVLPSQMFQVLHYDTFHLSCAWLRWDTMKVLATLGGGWLADRVEPDKVVFPLLFLLPIVLAATATTSGGTFESLVGLLFVCGTTQGAGLLGPSFVKLLASRTPPGVGFVKMFTAVDFCITLGIGAGNLAAGAAWNALGFAKCLYGLAAIQLLLACGTLHLHRPAHDHRCE